MALFPGLDYAALLIRVFAYGSKGDEETARAMAKAARTMYGDRLPEVAEFLGCMAKKTFP